MQTFFPQQPTFPFPFLFSVFFLGFPPFPQFFPVCSFFFLLPRFPPCSFPACLNSISAFPPFIAITVSGKKTLGNGKAYCRPIQYPAGPATCARRLLDFDATPALLGALLTADPVPAPGFDAREIPRLLQTVPHSPFDRVRGPDQSPR